MYVRTILLGLCLFYLGGVVAQENALVCVCEWKDFIIHLFFLVVVFLKCCPVVHSQEDTKAVGNSYAVFRHVERPAKMHTNTNTQTKRQLKKQNITAVIGNFGNLADEVSPTPSLYVCLFMLE